MEVSQGNRVVGVDEQGQPFHIQPASPQAMSDVAAWLTQVLDADEAGVREALATEEYGVSRFDLADIEAKRAIIANCLTWIRGEPENAWYDGGRPQDLAEETLRLLGSAYADRPGYLDEWKPRD